MTMEPAKRRGHVLVVDDDSPIRATLRAVLEDDGYLVAEAADGWSALAVLRSSPASVVLLDLMMPGLDGAGVLRAVADDPRLAQAHAFVLVTALTQPPAPVLNDLCVRLSVPLLRKPFDLDELAALVDAANARLTDTQ